MIANPHLTPAQRAMLQILISGNHLIYEPGAGDKRWRYSNGPGFISAVTVGNAKKAGLIFEGAPFLWFATVAGREALKQP